MTLSVDSRTSFAYQTETPSVVATSLGKNTEKWWYLEGTGFSVKLQIEKLLKEARIKILQGISLSKIIEGWTNQTLEDIRGFWQEYICRRLVLPIIIEMVKTNGKIELTCPQYGNQTLIEITSEEERNRAAKDSLEKIADFLIRAPAGSMAVLVSPAGWSGLKTSEGKDISYPETQIYAYYVERSGKIKALTIRTDNTLHQNEALVNWLNGQESSSILYGNTNQRIETVVRSPIFIEGGQEDFGFDKLIRALQIIKNSSFVLENKTFIELMSEINNINKFVETDQITAELTADFKKFMIREISNLNINMIEAIAEKLGKTVLGISAAKRVLDNRLPILLFDEWFYRRELDHLRTIGGCNGGGLGLDNSMTMLGLGIPRLTTLGETSNRRKHCGKCGKTGYFAEGETCPYTQRND